MISIQEMVNKTETTAKQVKEQLEHGFFDYQHTNLWGTGYDQDPRDRVKPAVVKEVWDTVKNAPLREFLAKSGTTGIAGAAYLIPTKIYQVMYDSSVEADVVADISMAVVPAEQIGGTTMNVDIAVDESYLPKKYSSGGAMPTETIQTTQATLDFSTPWGINFKITNDLIEDAQFDVIEMHLRNAGREMGEYASNEALTVLKTATDGDGTVNTGTTGDANETKWLGATTFDIVDALNANFTDGYVSDTCVLTHGAALHSVFSTSGLVGNDSALWNSYMMGGWPTQMGGMNIVYSDVNTLTNSKVGDNLITIVFDKDYALLSGRKRWLRIENYSDPIRDMVGATITARQDSVSVYNDSICVMTET
jgi:HK97 family phage major capsid protein